MDNFLLSYIMMILWSVLFGLLFITVRKTKVLRNRFGITACIVVCVCLYVRMMVPFDIGLFQPVQIEWEWFCRWYDILNMAKPFFGVFSVTQVLCFVWISTGIAHFLRWVNFYRRIWCNVSDSGLPGDKMMNSVLDKVIRDGGFRRRPEIVMIKNFRSAYSIGLIHQKILVPPGKYSEQELYYIFYHEMTHFKKGDLWLKAISNVMICLFWWNPLVHLLQRELDAVLEIRCDVSVTEGKSLDERRDYLKTIVSVMKEAGPGAGIGFRGMKLLMDNALGFVKPSTYEDMMRERFNAVASEEKAFGEKKLFSALWIAAMVGLMVLSYTFVVLPYRRPNAKGEEISSEVMPGDIHVTELGDGKYILHFEADGEEYEYAIDEEDLLELEKSRGEME